jgi:hypothetical protein
MERKEGRRRGCKFIEMGQGVYSPGLSRELMARGTRATQY